MNPRPKTTATVSNKSLWGLLGVTAVAAVLMLLFPDRQDAFFEVSGGFLVEVLTVLPAIVLFIGLFGVFVPKELVGRYLGKASGVKGYFVALFLGMLPTGPLYVAFPLASALLRKGASVFNVVVFLTAWAGIKLPQEMAELAFMGLPFTLTRLSLTLVAAAVTGFLVSRVAGPSRRL